MTTLAVDGPIAPAQERLWLADQLDPGTTRYSISAGYRIRGLLEEEALAAAFADIVDRHDALRTNLVSERGQPRTRIRPAAEGARLRVVVPTRSAHSRDRWSWAAAFAQARLGEPFGLGTEPLIRADLLRVKAGEHLLLLTAHHAVIDDWSLGIVLDELGACYRARVTGRSHGLPPAPAYRDFALSQRAAMYSPRAESDLSYWRRRLAGAPEESRPAADVPPASFEPYSDAGAETRFAVGPQTTARLRETGIRERATMFVLGLAAFTLALSARIDNDEVVVGIPSAGRDSPETASTVGFFVKTLPIRIDLSGTQSLRETARRVRTAVLMALAHDLLPFHELVRRLGRHESPERHPLFQTHFQLLYEPNGEGVDWQGARVTPWPGCQGSTTRFDLEVTLVDVGDRLLGTICRRTSRYTTAMAVGLAADITEIIRNGVA